MNTLRVLTAKLPLIHTSVRHYYLKPRRSSNSKSQALLLAAGVVTGLFGCSVYFLGKCLLLLLLLFYCLFREAG